MNNTTNHVTNTLFSKRNEERVVNLLEKLVDHITAKPLQPEHQAWLDTYKNAGQGPSATGESTLIAHEHRIKQLEMELRAANAKLSQRL